MRIAVLFTLIFQLLAVAAVAGQKVEMKTNVGVIRIELDDKKAPESVANFLSYVDQKFYDGTIFHRIIDGFMVQGGGFDVQNQRKQTAAPIKNEATNGLKNFKGTIAMARTNVVDSATSQFFINLVDNAFLDNRGTTPQTYGYAVFGQVVDGMEVVEKIAKVKTTRMGPFQNYPAQPVIIESVRRIE